MIQNDHLESFTGLPWPQYLNSMSKDGTFGDAITLKAISDIFKVEIFVVSTLGKKGSITFRPENFSKGKITLGHFAEGHGYHYCVLEKKQCDLDSIQGISSDRAKVGNLEDSSSCLQSKIKITMESHHHKKKDTLTNLSSSDGQLLQIKRKRVLPSMNQAGEIHVTFQHLIDHFGLKSRPIQKLKSVINLRGWHKATLVLEPKGNCVYLLKDLYFKNRRPSK